MNIKELIAEKLKEMDDDDNDKCLISHEKLNWSKITLPCGHSFNYEHIYNELKIQMKNHFTIYNSYIHKCPFCRKQILKLLPPCTGFRPAPGVNKSGRYYDFPPLFVKTCEYVFKRGKNKGRRCDNYCVNEDVIIIV